MVAGVSMASTATVPCAGSGCAGFHRTATAPRASAGGAGIVVAARRHNSVPASCCATSVAGRSATASQPMRCTPNGYRDTWRCQPKLTIFNRLHHLSLIRASLGTPLAEPDPGAAGPKKRMEGRRGGLFFLWAGRESLAGLHVRALSRISRLVRQEGVRAGLREARTPQEFYRTLCEAEEA